MTGVLIAVILSAGCAVSAFYFLRAYRDEKYVRGFWLKGAAALFFVAVGVVLFLCGEGTTFGRLTLGGLILGLCGDQLLAMRLIHKKQHDLFFTIGALSFGVGHVLYVMALQSISALKGWIILPVFLVGGILSLLYAIRKGTNVGKKTPLAVGYIAIVLAMASVAISAAVQLQSAAGILFSVGGVLFCISDNILCAYCYGRNPVWRLNRDIHITYYAAQLAIAWSILFV